jgi:thiamine monophosphate synthase
MILGAPVNSVQEAEVVVRGAISDYIGIGPVWDTSTKKPENGKTVVGARGVGPILDVLQGTRIKPVVISTYRDPCICIYCY